MPPPLGHADEPDMSKAAPNTSLRPRMVTVFVAAFLAGGTGAVGVNRFIDVNRTRAKATVECEPIFVAIRDLPAGNPVTVWDVKLRDWPKAMVPQAALRPGSFDGIAWPDGHVARLSLREGQPVLRSHLQSTIVNVPPAVPQPVAVSGPVAVTEPVRVVERPAPVAEPTTDSIAQSPIAARIEEQPADAVEPPTVDPPTLADTTPAADSTADAVAEVETTLAADPTPADPVTGEGWPSTAEAAAGSESAMRFLVVPERIAIMADELTAPRKPQPPSTPVASLATQPKQAMNPAENRAEAGRNPQTRREIRPDSSVHPGQSAPASKAVTRPPLPKAKYPDQAPSTKPRPKAATSSPTPRVTVEPDAESQLADEAARSPTLKTVFPNMAAGLEKIESEMSRLRRDRFGSLFRSSSGDGEEGPR